MRYFELYEEKNVKLLNMVPNIHDLQSLGNIFKKYNKELRLVGGVVRDLLQNKKPKDVDLATTATPDDMIKIAEENNIKYIPTGLQHGTITYVINSEPYEITTLRIDKETDGRHAEIEFTTDWQQDAERRDLTFNAISMGLDGEIYDYFDGIIDLKNGRAKFVGDSDKRITEDYLRILRYFRFQGRVANPSWDKETLNSIKNNANGLSRISGERIWMELSKILSGNHVSELLKYMADSNVLNLIDIPTNNINNINNLSNITKDPVVMLAHLLNNENEVSNIDDRYKLSSNEREKLKFLVTNKDKKIDYDSAVESHVMKKTSLEYLSDLAKLQNNSNLSNELKNVIIPKFPVSGKDLADKGIKPGPEMGKILEKMRKEWVKSKFKLGQSDLLLLV